MYERCQLPVPHKEEAHVQTKKSPILSKTFSSNRIIVSIGFCVRRNPFLLPHLGGLPPEVPAPHDVLRGGLAPEAPGDEDLLRGGLAPHVVAGGGAGGRRGRP